MKQIIQGVWIFFFALYVFYFFRHYPELPEKFVTHWGTNGQPNGWSFKEDFRNQFFALSLFVNALFWALAHFIDVIPETLINWPNKEWWFSNPERKQMAFDHIKCIFSLTGVYLNLVFLFCIHVIFQGAQIPVPFQISVGDGAMVILGLAASLVVAALYLSFRKPN